MDYMCDFAFTVHLVNCNEGPHYINSPYFTNKIVKQAANVEQHSKKISDDTSVNLSILSAADPKFRRPHSNNDYMWYPYQEID